jgi:N-acetylmuramic acid 6-phosphate etherase
MSTEDVSPRYLDLDVWETRDALKMLHEDQVVAVAAVEPALPAIALAVEDAAPRLRRGGRLVYVGAGTSARIGVQDGAELPPTFNWPHDRLAFAIAGDETALLRAVENAEDSAANGAARIDAIGVAPEDVVIGLAASGNTPFTVSAMKRAKERGALTIGVANNRGSQLLSVCDHAVLIETGAEAIAGSTRMKAGTAQKVVLNLFSTMVMVRLGRVYRGLMVDMRPTNEKLRRRSVQMVARIMSCGEDRAGAALADADGDVKLAVLLANGTEKGAAKALLKKHDGSLRLAMAEIGRS